MYGSPAHQAMVKNMREDGLTHPSELTKPALKPEDRRYYDAFRALSASRMWSQVGPSPIQVSEVSAYMGLAGIEDPDTKLKYLRLVQGLDIVEMNSIRAKNQ